MLQFGVVFFYFFRLLQIEVTPVSIDLSGNGLKKSAALTPLILATPI